MIKLIAILIFLILINNSQLLNGSRSWLYSCSEDDCLKSINKCIEKKCFGEKSCIDCVKADSFNCNQCANEIFKKSNLINGDLICFENDVLQESVCQLYCRGLFGEYGQCRRNEKSIPICQCEDNKTTTTTTTATTEPAQVNLECKNIIFKLKHRFYIC
jgi:hypothetical protein